MIPASVLDEWAGLFEAAAACFDAKVSAAAPGSPEYIEFRSLAADCAEAADDARWQADEAREADEARAEIRRLRSAREGDHAPA